MRKLKKIYLRLIKNVHAENTRVFEYYMCILPLTLGNDPLGYGTLCTIQCKFNFLTFSDSNFPDG